MNDLFKKLEQNKGNIGKWADKAEGYFVFPELKGAISNRMQFNAKENIVWSVNDYLGLADNQEIKEEDLKNTKTHGITYPMGSRMMTGETNYHQIFEENLADFVNKDKALLLNFGYQGMFSIIDALVCKNDVIIYDSDSHACTIDGSRLHIGKKFVFQNNNMESLKINLERATKIVTKTGGGILVISEGVFGMSGEQGLIKEIIKLKETYNFRLLVDDAHGFGAIGEGGKGIGSEQNCQKGIDLYFSTFTKSMASLGAFIAGKEHVIDYLKYNVRSQIFAKSLPLVLVKSGIKRLKYIRKNPQLKDRLWEITKSLQMKLRKEGFDIGKTNSCITPIYLKISIPEAMLLVHDLRENHRIFCSIVIYPVVPKGIILLRLIPTASHNADDIEKTITAFKTVKKNIESSLYLNKN